MRVPAAFTICVLLLGQTGMCAVESLPEWEALKSNSSFSDFSVHNRASTVDLSKIDSVNKSDIRGLRFPAAAMKDWPRLGKELTNLVWARITVSEDSLPADLFVCATNFPRLQYLHVQCRKVGSVPSGVQALTNIPGLTYLGIDAPLATNFSKEIYALGSLKELALVVGPLQLPDGISHLARLKRLSIHGRRAGPVQVLPSDLPGSALEQLELANVIGLEKLLPNLPPNLVQLSVLKCDLQTIPSGWLNLQKVRLLDLVNNQLTRFPSELLALPELQLLGLDLNRIRSVPPLEIPKERKIEISLLANPIQEFASENNSLLERGVIKK